MLDKNVAKQAKSNPKKVWQFINNKTRTRPNIPVPFVDKDTPTSSNVTTSLDKEKANVLNQYFVSVFTKEDALYDKVILDRTECKMIDIDINEEMVKKKLLNLKIHKSKGPDGIHLRVLKELASVICVPLAIIFKPTGILPDEWKLANDTAIHKNGNRQMVGNYRPVSLTLVVCKVLESIVRERVINHMKSNKLFSSKRFGSIGGRPTTLQLLRVLDEWTTILDNGGSIDVTYFDFMKAFDKVSHNRLILKLKSYGIGGVLLDWLKAFLMDRKQRVGVNDEYSKWTEVPSRVPQGWVLGPVLFVVYINDLPDKVTGDSMLYVFADDTKLSRAILDVSDAEILQQDTDNMDEWSREWLVEFHPLKYNVLKMGRMIADLHDIFNFNTLRQHQLEVVDREKDFSYYGCWSDFFINIYQIRLIRRTES